MQVSDQIIAVLDNLCEKFGLAIDWTSETILPHITVLAEHLVTYEIWKSAASIVMMVFWTIVSIILTKKFYPTFKKKIEENRHSYSDFWEMASVFVCIGLALLWLGALICISVNTMQIIKCLTFPELFIFEYIQNLINTTG